MWNNEWIKGVDYPEWGDTDVYKKREASLEEVTGAGGGIGQGVIKSLKMIKDIDIRIIATDINELSAGLYAVDKSYIIERHNSIYYLENFSQKK